MRRHPRLWCALSLGVTAALAVGIARGALGQPQPSLVATAPEARLEQSGDEEGRRGLGEDVSADRMLAEGLRTFRFDTFGSEDSWAGSIKLHQAIEGKKLGGIGPGLSPKKATRTRPESRRRRGAEGDGGPHQGRKGGPRRSSRDSCVAEGQCRGWCHRILQSGWNENERSGHSVFALPFHGR
jgi:hypothetical protein